MLCNIKSATEIQKSFMMEWKGEIEYGKYFKS